jgi:cytochrome c oxidase subunit II
VHLWPSTLSPAAHRTARLGGVPSGRRGGPLHPDPVPTGLSEMSLKPMRFSRLDRPGATLLAWLLPLFLLGCAEEYPQSTIHPRSDFAEIIHSLYVSIFWWTMLILAVVWVLLAYILVRYRAREGAPEPKQIRGHLGLEIGWTVGPALIVVAIAIPTIQAVFATQRPLSDDAVNVEVTGHQFWWEFHYPEYGITTANELWLPVDRPVNLRLGSTDVIHSFWVPMLGGKRDVNPVMAVREGRDPKYNWLYLTPNEVGQYYGQCAEFCGESHAFMAMRVQVEPPAEFERWVERWRNSDGADFPASSMDVSGMESEPSPPLGGGFQEDPQVSLGREIFLNQSTCVACHAIQGTTAAGERGPNLTLFGARSALAAGILENNASNLIQWIRDPHSFKPGAAMPGTTYPGGNWPATNLSDDQVAAVAAYLLSLK